MFYQCNGINLWSLTDASHLTRIIEMLEGYTYLYIPYIGRIQDNRGGVGTHASECVCKEVQSMKTQHVSQGLRGSHKSKAYKVFYPK